MTEPFYFGELPRSLFGAFHPALGQKSPDHDRQALLVCPPLLQDAIRSHRALWRLGETLSEGGVDTLRFDWFGTGDSAGDDADVLFEGLVDDVGMASEMLASMTAATRMRRFGLRSSALPLLAHAARQRGPVDLVLWDPCLDGGALVEGWRRQQQEQMTVAGRYPYGAPTPDDDELMGFAVADVLCDALSGFDGRKVVLPAGSRLLLAEWSPSVDTDAFVAHQLAAGVQVERLLLDPDETPPFDQPRLFESQLFPRRSVALLARRIVGGGGE
ncbi:alpha/beta hydrolase family protein [Marilutibacter alkalisoli]|uniref:hypothetical protein n=1 Tax=Marilutibacter alkalisoli TaxID=2591633 RepID=UPI001420A722|nr:hypothetical protein [Lysobacter alkalisoli]